eukprot:19915_1
MSQPFVFGQPQIPDKHTMVYVNKEPLSQKMYRRLCSNPDGAIILYDKHNDENTKRASIYNGYDLNTHGLTTLFDKQPLLSECQEIWNQQLHALAERCTNHCCVIIIESNLNPNEPNIKHALGRLLPMDYRLDLQHKLDAFQSQLDTLSETSHESNSVKVRGLSEHSDINNESTTQTISPSGCASASNDDSDVEEEEDSSDNPLLVFSNFINRSMQTMRQFVQIGQFIDTMCLGLVLTKYLFLCKKKQSVFVLFENESDAQLIVDKMNGMCIANVTESLVIKYANPVLTKKIKQMFGDIERKQAEYGKQQRMKRLQKQAEEEEEILLMESEHNSEPQTCSTLLNAVGADEMVFDLSGNKILSCFDEQAIGQYIKNMIVTQELNVWQYKDYKASQWRDVDRMICMYLNLLPLNETVRGSQFELTRRSEFHGVFKCYKEKTTEYKLNRITKSMQSGKWVPSFWEKQMLNRSLNKTYLYSIDLGVLSYFGVCLDNKYPSIWYESLKQYLSNDKIESVASVQNWVHYHSFYVYSNWRIASNTAHGCKLVHLWYIQTDMNVLKNGFYAPVDTDDTEWCFYRDLDCAIKANHENNNILLCKVCIDGKQAAQLLTNNAFCKLSNTLCGLPELCIRFRKG